MVNTPKDTDLNEKDNANKVVIEGGVLNTPQDTPATTPLLSPVHAPATQKITTDVADQPKGAPSQMENAEFHLETYNNTIDSNNLSEVQLPPKPLNDAESLLSTPKQGELSAKNTPEHLGLNARKPAEQQGLEAAVTTVLDVGSDSDDDVPARDQHRIISRSETPNNSDSKAFASDSAKRSPSETPNNHGSRIPSPDPTKERPILTRARKVSWQMEVTNSKDKNSQELG